MNISQTAHVTMGSSGVKIALATLALELGVPNLCIDNICDSLVPRAQKIFGVGNNGHVIPKAIRRHDILKCLQMVSSTLKET